MSTRSYIGFTDTQSDPPENYHIYCHSDGYLAYVGKMLYEHYNSLTNAKQITELGDLSWLGYTLNPPCTGLDAPLDEKIKNAEAMLNGTFSYHRDRGVPKERTHREWFKDIDTLYTTIEGDPYIEYIYIFDASQDEWVVRFNKPGTIPRTLKYMNDHDWKESLLYP